MKKKLYITRTVKLCCLMLALLFTLSFMQTYALRRLDHNSIRLNGFYHEDHDSVDVVVLGASEVYTSFASAYAYEEYGFTSYPFATESITTDGTLTALKEIIRTQHPKLVLIEPNAYLYGKAENEVHDGHIRKLVDNIPLNENKIDFINRTATSDEIEYYLPLIKYHDTWKDYPLPLRRVISTIKQDVRGYSYLKGLRTTTEICVPDDEILNEKVSTENGEKKLNATLEKKLIELLEYCKAENVNAVFFRTPHLVVKSTYTRVKRSNYMARMVNSYGFDYINMERDWKKTKIDPKTDFYNYDHPNIYGTVKITSYLGNILKNKYGIGKSELTEAQKARWDEAAVYFDKLYRYCDDLIKNHEVIQIEEDINTLKALESY